MSHHRERDRFGRFKRAIDVSESKSSNEEDLPEEKQKASVVPTAAMLKVKQSIAAKQPTNSKAVASRSSAAAAKGTEDKERPKETVHDSLAKPKQSAATTSQSESSNKKGSPTASPSPSTSKRNTTTMDNTEAKGEPHDRECAVCRTKNEWPCKLKTRVTDDGHFVCHHRFCGKCGKPNAFMCDRPLPAAKQPPARMLAEVVESEEEDNED